MNNKGFAVTGMLYILLLIFVSMFITILAMFANRLNIYEKIKDEIVDGRNIYARNISFNNTSVTIHAGETFQLVVTFGPDNVTQTMLAWTSSDEGIATVSETGLITGVSVGTVTITARTVNDKIATATVNITEALPTIADCTNCVFAYHSVPVSQASTVAWTFNTTLTDTSLYTSDYRLLEKNYFLGLKLNETTKKIEKAYSCGIKDGTPFCIEGRNNDGSMYSSNKNKLIGLYGNYDSNTSKGCTEDGTTLSCLGTINAQINSTGMSNVGVQTAGCIVGANGMIGCFEE